MLFRSNGICISDDAYRRVRGEVQLAFEDMGEQALKNVSKPMRTFRIAADPGTNAGDLSESEGLSLPSGVAELSLRELEIARAHVGGADHRDIAERLMIAPNSVRTQLRSIYQKMSVS